MDYFQKMREALENYINDYEKTCIEYKKESIRCKNYEILLAYCGQPIFVLQKRISEICELLNTVTENESASLSLKNTLLKGNLTKKGNYQKIFSFMFKVENDNYRKAMQNKDNLQRKKAKFASNIDEAKTLIAWIDSKTPINPTLIDYRSLREIFEYDEMNGFLTEKEHILVLNALYFYNNKLRANKEPHEAEIFKTKYEKVLNAILLALPTVELPEIDIRRVDTTHAKIKEIELMKQYGDEFMLDPIKQYYNILDMNEFNYILGTILMDISEELFTYLKLLADYEIYANDKDRNEVMNNYYKLLDTYLLLYAYYNEANTIIMEEATEEELETILPAKKRFIFASSITNPDKVRIITDMQKDVNPENYERISKLLSEFKNGTLSLKGDKKLTHQRKHKGLCELRNDQIRILYRHIKDDIYCIVGVAVKKTDLDDKMLNAMAVRPYPNVDSEESLSNQLARSTNIEERIDNLIITRGRKGIR